MLQICRQRWGRYAPNLGWSRYESNLSTETWSWTLRCQFGDFTTACGSIIPPVAYQFSGLERLNDLGDQPNLSTESSVSCSCEYCAKTNISGITWRFLSPPGMWYISPRRWSVCNWDAVKKAGWIEMSNLSRFCERPNGWTILGDHRDLAVLII